jgi:hypothetical protein
MSNRGGSRIGAGRKKGSLNRTTAEARALAARSGETPLAYMLRVMHDSSASDSRRDDMAKSAAPYLHAKISTTAFAPMENKPAVTRIKVVFVDPPVRDEGPPQTAPQLVQGQARVSDLTLIPPDPRSSARKPPAND